MNSRIRILMNCSTNSLLSTKMNFSRKVDKRKCAIGARSAGRTALAEQEAEKLSRREERVITLLNKAVELILSYLILA